MNTKYTLTIGIPAHNEEANIRNMIVSVLKQKGDRFILEQILVVLDGCTDNTLKIAKDLARKHKMIKVIHDGRRYGKAARLNQIHRLNTSQLVGTFDADIVLERDCELEVMVKEFAKNESLRVVAARQYPAKSNTLMGRFSNASFLMLQNASMKWRNGNNIHSLQGSTSILNGKFARSFKYPDTVCDQGYLYLTAIKNGRNGFRFAKDTRIIFRAADTFTDWRKLGARTVIYDKEDISRFFGKRALVNYKMPKKYIYRAIRDVFFRDPIGAFGSVILNYYIRLFPYTAKMRQGGIWETISSSKKSIEL